MDHPACPGRPSLHSPPESSYLSAASRPSTRPPSPATSSPPSSSLELGHLATPIIEQRTGNTRLDLLYAMDNTAASFDDANSDRSRLASERSRTASQQQQQQQPQPQPQPQPTGALVSSQTPRNMNSSNWRAQVLNESHESDLPYRQQLLRHQERQRMLRQQYTAMFESPARVEQQQQQQQQADPPKPTPSTTYKPLTAADGWYAYCLDRGNGQYTRLIPADMLPPLRDIPAVQQGCLGMIVLPQPPSGQAAQAKANGPSSPAEWAGVKTPPVTPAPPPDNIQTQIDTIVATTPTTPTRQGPGSSSGSASSSATAPSTALVHVLTPLKMPRGGGGGHGGLQSSYHAAAPSQPPPPAPPIPGRRPKIYCDKWVHEGVCAFTQQGCKYKHEMPLDRLTQHQLGLFHGLPAWWKKHQADLARQREPVGGVGGVDGEPEPPSCLLGDGGGRANNAAAPHHQQAGGGPGPVGGTGGGGGVLGARGGRLAAGSSALGDNNTPWRRATGPAGADRDSTGHRLLGPPLSPHRLGAGGRHPTMTPSSLVASRDASPAPWNASPYGPIAPPTPAPNPNQALALPARSVATNNPYATLDATDDDSGHDAARTG